MMEKKGRQEVKGVNGRSEREGTRDRRKVKGREWINGGRKWEWNGREGARVGRVEEREAEGGRGKRQKQEEEEGEGIQKGKWIEREWERKN